MRAREAAAHREPPSRPSDSLSRSRGGIADHQNAEAKQRDAGPAQGADILAQEKMAQQRDDHVGHGRSRLHETEISPRQNQSVGNKKSEQQYYAEPHRAGSKRAREKAEHRGWVLHAEGPDFLHAVAQEHVAQRAERDHK